MNKETTAREKIVKHKRHWIACVQWADMAQENNDLKDYEM